MSNNLNKYHAWLLAHQIAHPISCRPETRAELKVKTLWIPAWSGNRTATIDLNHEINPDIPTPTDYPYLIGYNGNCGTAYQIIEVPLNWNQDNIDQLAQRVAIRLAKPADYPYYRVLKADNRMSTILEEITGMMP